MLLSDWTEPGKECTKNNDRKKGMMTPEVLELTSKAGTTLRPSLRCLFPSHRDHFSDPWGLVFLNKLWLGQLTRDIVMVVVPKWRLTPTPLQVAGRC